MFIILLCHKTYKIRTFSFKFNLFKSPVENRNKSVFLPVSLMHFYKIVIKKYGLFFWIANRTSVKRPSFLFVCGHPPVVPRFSGVPQSLGPFGIHHHIVHTCTLASCALLARADLFISNSFSFSRRALLEQEQQKQLCHSWFIYYISFCIFSK